VYHVPAATVPSEKTCTLVPTSWICAKLLQFNPSQRSMM